MKAVIIALLLCSCSKKTYVVKSEPVKVVQTHQDKKQKTIITIHLLALAAAGWISHSLSDD